MESGHLLTRSGITRVEFSLTFSLGFFCLLVCRFSTLGNLFRGVRFTHCNKFLMYSCVLSKNLGYIYSFYNLHVCFTICPSVSCCFSHMFRFSLLEWSNFHYLVTQLEGLQYYIVFIKGFCGLNVLLIMPAKYLLAQNTECFLLKSCKLKERKLFSTPQRPSLCQRRRKSCSSESYEHIEGTGNTGPQIFYA